MRWSANILRKRQKAEMRYQEYGKSASFLSHSFTSNSCQTRSSTLYCINTENQICVDQPGFGVAKCILKCSQLKCGLNRLTLCFDWLFSAMHWGLTWQNWSIKSLFTLDSTSFTTYNNGILMMSEITSILNEKYSHLLSRCCHLYHSFEYICVFNILPHFSGCRNLDVYLLKTKPCGLLSFNFSKKVSFGLQIATVVTINPSMYGSGKWPLISKVRFQPLGLCQCLSLTLAFRNLLH